MPESAHTQASIRKAMPLFIIQGDITKLTCDAIVNAANNSLRGGSGVDGAIHNAAGPGLLAECAALNGCDTGDAKITKGYDLKAKYVIHTVGPVYDDGNSGEEELLRSCYARSLSLAVKHGCESIAFPMISAGVYGYPYDLALEVAVSSISSFLETYKNDLDVFIVVYSKREFKVDKELYRDVLQYVSDNNRSFGSLPPVEFTGFAGNGAFKACASSAVEACEDQCASPVEDYVRSKLDESFTQMLLRMIDEKGMTDVECYKRANVDRKLFSKIRSNMNYHPRKRTALGFAVSLRLTLEETKDLLMKAGYALSDSNHGDLAVEYFITNKIYDINKINEVLFAMDQEIIGEY